ncbi:hypothetical protein [Mangrovimonas sp. ST2L15]|uniref:hypothetical protein n=1 Tax=Mangrovimonas sp. ST2L15 TaxID=1645916 RepID=UPI0006B5AE8D|nr:hypothetical protein [Mangrovimonas sp. ST2L15]
MKTSYLLPNQFKILGWPLFITGLILGIIIDVNNLENDFFTIKVLSIYQSDSFLSSESGFFKLIENDILDELAALAIIIGGLILCFSKEKIEDEFIAKLRKDSLVWAFLVNYIVLILAIIFVYDLTFFSVLIFNMFTPIIIYVFRFHFLRLKSMSHDE